MTFNKSKLAIALMSLAMAFGTIGVADAGTWTQHHPRRAEVNERLHRQDLRIKDERREGEFTKTQVRDLHAEDHGIRAEEKLMASRHDGHLTKADQRMLNHQENTVSKQIGR